MLLDILPFPLHEFELHFLSRDRLRFVIERDSGELESLLFRGVVIGFQSDVGIRSVQDGIHRIRHFSSGIRVLYGDDERVDLLTVEILTFVFEFFREIIAE